MGQGMFVEWMNSMNIIVYFNGMLAYNPIRQTINNLCLHCHSVSNNVILGPAASAPPTTFPERQRSRTHKSVGIVYWVRKRGLVWINLPGGSVVLDIWGPLHSQTMHPHRRKNTRVFWKCQGLASVGSQQSVSTMRADWRLRGDVSSWGPQPWESLSQVCSPNYNIYTAIALRMGMLLLANTVGKEDSWNNLKAKSKSDSEN